MHPDGATELGDSLPAHAKGSGSYSVWRRLPTQMHCFSGLPCMPPAGFTSYRSVEQHLTLGDFASR